MPANEIDFLIRDWGPCFPTMGINKPISVQVIESGIIESVTVQQVHKDDTVTLDVLTRVSVTPVNSSSPLTLVLKLFNKNHALVASQIVAVSHDMSCKNLQMLSGRITVPSPQLWFVLKLCLFFNAHDSIAE